MPQSFCWFMIIFTGIILVNLILGKVMLTLH